MFSRRRWLATGVALLAALSLTSVLAAPFASDRITVRTEGAGPDVVLIPGLNSSPRAWASTVAAPVADEIVRYIREANLKQPAVTGHSMGGTIGMMLASRHPDTLSRLMVVDMYPFLGSFFAGPGAAPARVEAVADGIAGMVDTEAMRPGAIEDSMSSDPDVGIRAYRELIVTNLIPELPKISVPVTVLYVQPKSVPLPAEQFDGVYKSAYAPIKNLTLKRIADSAHFIMWDQPQRFQAEVKAFLPAR